MRSKADQASTEIEAHKEAHYTSAVKEMVEDVTQASTIHEAVGRLRYEFPDAHVVNTLRAIADELARIQTTPTEGFIESGALVSAITRARWIAPDRGVARTLIEIAEAIEERHDEEMIELKCAGQGHVDAAQPAPPTPANRAWL